MGTRATIRAILKTRRQLERKAAILAYKAIRKQYSEVLDYMSMVGAFRLQGSIENVVNSDAIESMMVNIYQSSAVFSSNTRNRLLNEQKGEAEIWDDIFISDMRTFVLNNESLTIQKITETTRKKITAVIDEAIALGDGAELTARNIIKNLTGREANQITRSRARTIARTEVLKSSAEAQRLGAQSTGLRLEKKWEDSGLEGVRETHIANSSVGWVDYDFVFPNGLSYPGDPSGEVGEVVNCRCVLHERAAR